MGRGKPSSARCSHPDRGILYWGRAHETDGFDARRLVPDSDSRDCFWLLVPHSSMAASTVTDPSSQGATTRHAARRRGSDTRHDDASRKPSGITSLDFPLVDGIKKAV